MTTKPLVLVVLLPASTCLPDGMHPGDLGHELVARLLLPVVEGDVQ